MGIAPIIQLGTKKLYTPGGLWLASGVIFTMAAVTNATIMYDDPYMFEVFARLERELNVWQILKTLFFSLDLGGREYRLYGFSKIIHFGLWLIFGQQTRAYGTIIAVSHFTSGWLLFRVLLRIHADRLQAVTISATWILSPFLWNTVFHHYSYLLLPYQLTLLCAFILQQMHDSERLAWLWRSAAGVIGICIATSGEGHYFAAPAILAAVHFATSSSRTFRQRCVDIAIPIAIMAATACLHRHTWTVLTADYKGPTRFSPALPVWENFKIRTDVFLRTLPASLIAQVQAIYTLSGAWKIATAFLAGAGGFFMGRVKWPKSAGQNWLPFGIFLILVASLLLYCLMNAIGQLPPSGTMRHYGYVPNTLAVITLVAILGTPKFRNILGAWPVLLATTTIGWLWLTLVAICLPIVRSEDREVWRIVETDMKQSGGHYVLFINEWDHSDCPEHRQSFASPGMRGSAFPEIFQSPLAAYMWEAPFARTILGAFYVGYSAMDEPGGNVRIFGFGPQSPLMAGPSYVVPGDSLVVVVATGLLPPKPTDPLREVRVFPSWKIYRNSPQSHPRNCSRNLSK